MSVCIYCLRVDPPCGFNTEHVVPQALGRFQNNLTLNEEVCTECNQFFGDTLDRFLTRDSAEALLRFRYGLKDPAEVDAMFRERVGVTLPSDGSKWGGVHLAFAPPPPGSSEPYLDLVPQVGFELKDKTGWLYYTLTDLSERQNVAEEIDRLCGPRRVILFDSDDSKEKLLGVLSRLAIPFKKESEFTGFEPFEEGNVDAELTFRFDESLGRAICKIAVNYLTYMAGPELVLHNDLNPIREFVRHGGDPSQFITFLDAPQVRDAEGEAKEAPGHLLALSWDDTRRKILCKVCPFSHKTYLVRLCDEFEGIWREIVSAHFYDLQSMSVSPLKFVRLAKEA